MPALSDGVHYRTCSLCEATCGIEIRLDRGRIVSIRGDEQDPLSHGYVCPKAVALQDIQDDPDRLRHPIRRTPTGWERVPWNTVFDEVAARLRAVQRAHGRDSVALYFGNPTVHNYGALLFGGMFARALGSRSRFSATSVDQLPHHLASYLMYGHQLLLPIPDLDRTTFFLVLGANPVVSNGSLMTAPDLPKRLKAIRQRGGRIVVIDPRRTETAAAADRHLFIRPGTDVWLMAALLHTLFDEGLARPDRLEPVLRGTDVVERLVADVSPERVDALTGIAAQDIRELARSFATAEAAVCYGRVGVSTQEFGALTQWLIQVVNAVTGNLDRPGGALFTTPAVDLVARAGRGHYAKGRSRVRGVPEFNGEYPVATLAEEILTPGQGQLRGLLAVAGNPVLSTPNGAQLDRALASLDFMVAIDFYLNETTRHAHVVLPPTAPLEHDHFDLVFNMLAVRNTAKYSSALFEPAPDARHEWQIFLELASRLRPRDLAGRVRAAARTRTLRWLGPPGLLALALRTGPHGSGWNPLRSGLSLAALRRARHGIDLGPLAPSLPDRLRTKDKRIDLAPKLLVEEFSRIKAERLDAVAPSAIARDTLLLIGRRQLRSNNSWMHNAARLVKGKDRCTLLIHPDDADARGFVDGERVELRSRVGRIELPVEISDEMMPGVVSVPHGWGHDRPGTRLSVATEHAGASINDLTDDAAIDALCGNAAFSGTPVWAEPVKGTTHEAPPRPPVRAQSLPSRARGE